METLSTRLYRYSTNCRKSVISNSNLRTSNSEDGGVGDGKESDELEGINNNIRAELGTHVYAKISSSLPRLYVVDNRLNVSLKIVSYFT